MAIIIGSLQKVLNMSLPTTTRAAVLVETGQPLQIMDLQLPDLKPGQVLVKMDYAGVCHTQLHEVRGKRGEDRFLPHVLGHEGSGTVLAVGEGVEKVKVGEKVVLTWIKGVGADVPSTSYDSPIGRVNSGAISTFMTHTVTCENRLVPMREATMPQREAALLGCAVPTGAGTIVNTADVQKDSTVAIFGVGGIGLSAVLAANMRGAKVIIAVDVVDEKLTAAMAAGATHTINAAQENTVERIKELTDGKGVDTALEAAGKSQTMEDAYASVAYGGGLCVLAGNVAFGEKMCLDPYDLIKGRRIVGTWGGETDPDHDLPIYVEMYLKGKLSFGQLVSHEWALDDINTAFDELEAGRVSRALIRL